MPVQSAADSLDSILNILTTLTNEYYANKQVQQNNTSNDTSDLISDLMKGIAGSANLGVSVGQQVEALTKGLTAFEDLDITESDIQAIADIFGKLNKSLGKIKLNPENMKGVYTMIQALVTLGSVNDDILDNIIELNEYFDISKIVAQIKSIGKEIDKKTITRAGEFFALFKNGIGQNLKAFMEAMSEFDPLDPEVASSIPKFIIALNLKNIPELTDESIKSMKTVSNLVNSLVKLFSSVNILDVLTMPIKGKLIGKAVANFFKEFTKVIPDEEIKADLRNVGSLLKGLADLAGGKFSIWRLTQVLSEKNATKIANFFHHILNQLPDKKMTKDGLSGIVDLMKLLKDYGFKDVRKLRRFLTEKNGRHIGLFFKAVIDEIPNTKKLNNLKQVTNFIKTVSELNIISFKLALTMLNEKSGKKINLFMKALVKDYTPAEAKKIETFTKSIKTLATGLMIFSGAILLTAAGITLLGFGTVLEAGWTLLAFSAAAMGIVSLFSEKLKEIRQGSKALKEMAIFMGVLSVSVMILAVTVKILDGVSPSSIVMLAVIGTGLVFTMKIFTKLSNEWKRHGKDIMFSLMGISVAILAMSLSIGIITNIVADNRIEDVILGTGIMLLTAGVSILLLKLLGWVDKPKLMSSAAALAGLVVCMMGTSLIIKMMASIAENYSIGDILLGTGVVLATTTILILLTKLLSTVKKKNLISAVASLAVMTFITLGISLIIKELFIPIGEHIAEAGLGAIAVLATIGALVFGVKVLSKVKAKTLLDATLSVGVMAFILLGVSLIVKEIFIPIGKTIKETLFGGVAVLATLAIIVSASLILNKLMKGINTKRLNECIKVLGAMAIVFGMTAGIVYIFTEIGKNAAEAGWDNVLWAATSTVTLLGIMGGIGLALSKLIKNIDISAIGKGMLILGGMAAIIYLSSKSVGAFVNLAKKMSGISVEDLLKAGGTMASLMGIFGAIVVAIGLLASNPAVALGLAIGEALVAGLSILIWLTAKSTLSFAKTAVKLSELSVDKIAIGKKLIIDILVGMGEIIAAASLLSPFIAIGSAAMLPLLGIIALTGKVMRGFSNVLKYVMTINGGDSSTWETGVLKKGYDLTTTIIKQFQELMNMFGISDGWNVLWFKPVINSLDSTGQVIKRFADVIEYTTQTIDDIKISKFYTLIVGKGLKDKNSMIGMFNNTVDAFITLGDKLFMDWDFDRAIRASDRILNVCSKYIDVVAKIATLTYISGYDDNGKPIFDTISPETFGHAAEVLTNNFFKFVNKLKIGFNGISFSTAQTISLVGNSMKPLIDSMGRFVDVIMKIATGRVVIGYDDRGKEMFEQLSPEDFSAAAVEVTNNFLTFTTTLLEQMKTVRRYSIENIKKLGEAMMPMMSSIGGFVDAIMKVATGTVITGYDEKGHAEITQVKPEDMRQAAITVTATFLYFMETLITNTETMKEKQAETIEKFGSGIGPMMSSIGGFVDAILKMATGTYIDHYDKDGKPVMNPIPKEKMSEAADTIVTYFMDFMDRLVKQTSKLEEEQTTAIQALSGSVGPIIKTVSDFADAIIKIAGGSYQVGTDKDGRPLYNKLTFDQVKLAAGQVIGYYRQFLNTILEIATSEKFQSGGADAMTALGKAVGPVMSSVLDFSKMLIEFTKPNGEIIDPKTGKKSTFQLNPDTVGGAAIKIANAYMNFITTLVNSLQSNSELEKSVTTISGTMKSIAEITKTSATGANNLGALLKTIAECKELDAVANDADNNIASQFVKAIINVNNGLVSLAVYDYKAIKATAVDSANALASIYTATKNLNAVFSTLDQIKNLSDYEKMCNSLVESLNILVNVQAPVHDFSAFVQYMSRVDIVTRGLAKLEKIMSSANMVDACTRFVKNLAILTDPSVYSSVQKTSASMIEFGKDLDIFTVQVDKTRGRTIRFTASVDKARKAIEELDDRLVKHEKQRNETLTKMSEMFNKVAESISNVSSSIENLDENKILDNFKNIARLLDESNRRADEAQSFGDTSNNPNIPIANNTSQIQPFRNTVINNNTINNNQTHNSNSDKFANTGFIPLDCQFIVTFNFDNMPPYKGFGQTTRI